ncbi:MAG: hypothetical protein K6F89_02300, partial [Prevotella sp.]|nr:hypothetical protein [Prevotella sp.]
ISTLTDAISTAQGVYDGINDTPDYQDDIDGAISTLQSAISEKILAYESLNPEGDDVTCFIFRPGFENMTAITEDLSAGNGKDYSSEGWTLTTTGTWGYGAIASYNSEKKVNGATVPTADNAGNTGKALGISSGWTQPQLYQSYKIALPKGSYVLRVNAYNANTATQLTSRFGFVPTEGDAYLSTKTSFTSSTWETDEISFTLEANTEGYIQIGGTAVSGGSGDNAKVFFDNITLTYFAPLKLAQIQWQAVHDELAALDATLLPDAAESAITTELAKAVPTTTVDAVNEAKAALQALIDSYPGIKAAYDKVNALITLATNEKTNSTGTKTDIESAISTATTDKEDCATADALTTVYNTLETARQTYVLAAQPTEGNPFDYTFKITDAAVTSKDAWTNGSVNSGQQYTGAPDNTYLDFYNKSLNIQQGLGALRVGRYTLKAATRAHADVTNGNIYVSQNATNLNQEDIHRDGNTGGTLGNGWSWTEVDFTNMSDADITLGFYSDCGSSKWAGADDFRLLYNGDFVTSANAEAILASVVEGKMNAEVATAQTNAKNTFESSNTLANYAALQLAINAATESKNAYTTAGEILPQMKTLTEQTNVYTADALNTYYTQWKTKYDNNTLTNDEANALQNPFTTTGVRAAITVDDFLLSAWNSEPGFTAENSPYYINT